MIWIIEYWNSNKFREFSRNESFISMYEGIKIEFAILIHHTIQEETSSFTKITTNTQVGYLCLRIDWKRIKTVLSKEGVSSSL